MSGPDRVIRSDKRGLPSSVLVPFSTYLAAVVWLFPPQPVCIRAAHGLVAIDAWPAVIRPLRDVPNHQLHAQRLQCSLHSSLCHERITLVVVVIVAGCNGAASENHQKLLAPHKSLYCEFVPAYRDRVRDRDICGCIVVWTYYHVRLGYKCTWYMYVCI